MELADEMEEDSKDTRESSEGGRGRREEEGGTELRLTLADLTTTETLTPAALTTTETLTPGMQSLTPFKTLHAPPQNPR